MTEIYAPVVIGTAAALLTTFLLLLRISYKGRRPFVALTRRWVAASVHGSSFALAFLSAIAVASFSSIPPIESTKFKSASSLAGFSNAPHSSSVAIASYENASQALGALRDYANAIDANRDSAVASVPPGAVEAPDVDVMIAKLVTRLESNPNDVKGWKMLGWSYLNTDRPEEAAKAYETALKLEPNDVETQNALVAAKSAQN